MNGNRLKYYIQYAAYNIALNLMSGSVLQSFLLEKGVAGKSVSFLMAVMSAMQVVTLLGISGFVEKSRNIVKKYAYAIFAQIIFLLGLAVFCFDEAHSAEVFPVICVLGIVISIFQGIYTVLAYKVPYYILDIKDYGYINGIAGVVSGITGAAFSILLTFCINRFEYYKTMSVFFIAGSVMLAVSSLFAITFKTTQPDVKFQKAEKVSIFRYKPFYFLLLPNILRGFSFGVLRLITIIGYHCKIIDASAAGILTTLLFLTTTIGSYTYSHFSVFGKNGSIILISSILLVFFNACHGYMEAAACILRNVFRQSVCGGYYKYCRADRDYRDRKLQLYRALYCVACDSAYRRSLPCRIGDYSDA